MAIYGIGIDLVAVTRIQKALTTWPERFRSRVFTPSEVAFCEKVADRFLSYAGRFAAKEAFAKALGTGLRGAIAWREIEVQDNERTRPTLLLHGRARKLLGKRQAHLSITHLADYAAAVVVIEE